MKRILQIKVSHLLSTHKSTYLSEYCMILVTLQSKSFKKSRKKQYGYIFQTNSLHQNSMSVNMIKDASIFWKFEPYTYTK